MRSFIIIALIAAAAADVSHLTPKRSYSSGPDADAQVVSQNAVVHTDGFQQSFETSNGISAQEQGELRPHGEDTAINVQGSNSYVGPDGQQYQITYTANENGYQPQGAHLPTPPPIPEAILRSIKYNAEHPQEPEAPQKYNRF